MPEQINDGETGILVAPNNFEELAKAITELCDNAELRSHMGLAAIRKFKENLWCRNCGEELYEPMSQKVRRENQ